MDRDGRTVAATDRNRLGETTGDQAYFLDALRGNSTDLYCGGTGDGGYPFTYSRRIEAGNESLAYRR